MSSMKKEREQGNKTQKTLPPPPRPVRSNPMEWKLLGPAYMSHFGCATQALSQKFLYCLPYINRIKRKVTV